MSNIFLIALAGVLLVVIILAYMIARGNQMKRKLINDALVNAVPAQATVVSMARGGFKSGGKMELKLTLRVQHPTLAPYEASVKWVVDELYLPQVQPQQTIPVRVNRDHPERVYPDAEWAEFRDWTMKELKVNKPLN